MKNSIVKQLTLTFFSLLISSITWAQSLSGAGTSSNPYKITNADDWKTFGQWINDGKYTDKYYKLTADIGTANNPIRTMVGIWSEKEEDRRPFKGYFYGENHTITIDYEQNPDGKYTAPFVYTDGATINKIRIAGKINVEDGYAAGVIGVANGAKDTKINGANSVISVDITGSNHCGGIAVDGSKLSISSCAYNGKIVSDKDSAGFVAISSKNTTINYCLFAPATGSKIENGENFYIGGLDETHSSNYYYVYNATPAVESTQGVMVYTYYNDVPTMGFWLRKQLYDYNKYYVQGKAAFHKRLY